MVFFCPFTEDCTVVKEPRRRFRSQHAYIFSSSFATPMVLFKISEALSKRIQYFASFPQTGVSLRQMVEFGALVPL